MNVFITEIFGIKNIDTPVSKQLANFRLIGVIKNGKFVKISSKGDFGENKYLDIQNNKTFFPQHQKKKIYY